MDFGPEIRNMFNLNMDALEQFTKIIFTLRDLLAGVLIITLLHFLLKHCILSLTDDSVRNIIAARKNYGIHTLYDSQQQCRIPKCIHYHQHAAT